MAEEPVTIEPPSAIKLKKWRSPEVRAIACHSLEREPRAILDLCSVHRDGCVMAQIAPSLSGSFFAKPSIKLEGLAAPSSPCIVPVPRPAAEHQVIVLKVLEVLSGASPPCFFGDRSVDSALAMHNRLQVLPTRNEEA
jgi:hypothetical protein